MELLTYVCLCSTMRRYNDIYKDHQQAISTLHANPIRNDMCDSLQFLMSFRKLFFFDILEIEFIR